MTEISWPPVLGIGHKVREVFFHRCEIEGFEFLGVVKFVAHRVALGRILVQHFEVELIRPPISV